MPEIVDFMQARRAPLVARIVQGYNRHARKGVYGVQLCQLCGRRDHYQGWAQAVALHVDRGFVCRGCLDRFRKQHGLRHGTPTIAFHNWVREQRTAEHFRCEVCEQHTHDSQRCSTAYWLLCELCAAEFRRRGVVAAAVPDQLENLFRRRLRARIHAAN